MSGGGLDRGLKDYYAAQSLEGRDLAHLKGLASLGGPLRSRRMRGPTARALLSALLLPLAAMLVGAGTFHVMRRNDLRASLEREIAGRHHWALERELTADDFKDLKMEAEPHLDFAPLEPALLKTGNFCLQGGRYSMVRGVKALEMHLTDAQGRRYTLLESRADPDLEAFGKGERVRDGVRMRGWERGGLWMVLARDAD